MKKNLIIFLTCLIFSSVIKANPWLVVEGLNIGINILGEMSKNNSNTKIASNANYNGTWKNISSSKCKSKTPNTSFLDKDIIISNGKNVIFDRFVGKVNKGITGKKSVGINTSLGFLHGKLKNNQLHFKLRPNSNQEYELHHSEKWKKFSKCTFKFAKKQSTVKKENKLVTSSNNNKNKIITIKQIQTPKKIKLRRGMETYSNPIHVIPKGIYLDVIGESAKYYKIKYLNKVGWTLKKDLEMNDTTVASSKQLILYCKDKSGTIEQRKKSMYDSCGRFMKEITYAEYQGNANYCINIAKKQKRITSTNCPKDFWKVDKAEYSKNVYSRFFENKEDYQTETELVAEYQGNANYCINIAKKQKRITSTNCPKDFWKVDKAEYSKNVYSRFFENKEDYQTETELVLYCKDIHGQVFSRSKSSYTDCGYMKQITYAEFKKGDEKIKIKKKLKQENLIKKDQMLVRAKDGEAYAQAFLGHRYEYGSDSYVKSLRKASQWYTKAANQNQPYALLKLGIFHHEGKGGLNKDQKAALKYFKKAAQQSSSGYNEDAYEVTESNYFLGLYYEKGFGNLTIDINQAQKYYQIASSGGNEKAKIRIKNLEKTNFEKYVYCQNKYKKSLVSERYKRCQSDEKEITLAKYNQLNSNQTKTVFYCKDIHGQVFSRSKSLYTDCGYMKQITYAEFKKGDEKIKIKEKTKVLEKVVVNNDQQPPVISIQKIFEASADLIAEISGSVSDDNEIVLIEVDGHAVPINNGKFKQKLFVKPGGQNIEIVAMDKFGNRSNVTVQLKRSSKKIVKYKFDVLNPTLIKANINPSSVALIIGIEDYEITFAAPFAKNDALAFNDFVHSSLGVPQQNIKLLTNNQARRTNTLGIFSKWLPKIVKEDETDIYVFFSGHGLASDDGKDLYLLPTDGDPELLEDSTLLRNNLFKRIEKLNPRSVTIFLDTCYSGATRSDEFLIAAKPIFIDTQEQDIPSNFTVFSASAGRETAKVLPEAEHGLFSYYMMKGLEGEADSNNDQQITNGELHAFINKNVSRQANQTPQLAGDADRVLVQW